MIIAGNFKANLTRKDTAEYLSTLNSLLKSEAEKCYIFTPASALQNSVSDKIVIGAQNAYPAQKGAFTGELCVEQLDEFGIKTILIGHSERRHVLGESQEFLAKKFAFFASLGYQIFYCIGEPLDIRQQGFDAVCEYMSRQFEGIDLDYVNLVIAYEPVWAIGTGMTAEVKDIEQTHAWIEGKTKAPILYGGSVNGKNIEEILNAKGVSGALIGGYSLKAQDFASAVNLSSTKGE